MWAQPCGLTDTLLIGQNQSPSFPFEVYDIFNDDLSGAGQGLCGVDIAFAHQYVDNLELTLVSPSGQSVQLIGPNTDQQFEFTFGSIWRIRFVPCGELAAPDAGSLQQWDNEQTGNFASLGLYNGSYYPYQGCLEDFDTGPVNGTWTIQVGNLPSAYAGAIIGFQLAFCDPRGLDCCFAVPGELSGPDILACEGDSILSGAPEVVFAGAPADTIEYGYTFLIGQDGVLQAVDALPDMSAYPPGRYEVCGLSYLLADSLLLPVPDGTLTLDSIRNDTEGLTPSFCGAITPQCRQVEIAEPPALVALADTICRGAQYAVGDSLFSETGFYEVRLTGYGGCDSLVALDLAVLEPIERALAPVICFGDAFAVGDSLYTETGFYTDTLTAASGCDSIVSLNLVVRQPIQMDTALALCAGEGFLLGDSLLTASGTYTDTLIAASGCDSIIHVNLTVLGALVEVDAPDTLTCGFPVATLNSTVLAPEGTVALQWVGPEGILGSAPQQEANTAGLYVLTATVSEGDRACLFADTVQVPLDTLKPSADAGPSGILTCAAGSLLLGGTGTSMGNDYAYLWGSADGAFETPPFEPQVTVSQAGTYVLSVIDVDSRCEAADTVVITADQSIPMAVAGPGGFITCDDPVLSLNGTGSTTGADIVYSWTSADGHPIEQPASLMPVVAFPGTYQLRVLDTASQCADSTEVTVGLDTLSPRLLINADTVLTCLQDTLVLEGNVLSSGGPAAFSWEAFNGGAISGADTLSFIEVAAPGSYQAILEDSANGCRDTALIDIIQDTTVLDLSIAPPDTLTCSRAMVLLQGTASTASTDIVYAWTGPAGGLVGDAAMLEAEAARPGAYQLMGVDTTNGCFAIAAVEVFQDTLSPVADAGPDRLLTCTVSSVTLSGPGTSIGPGLDYDWIEVIGTGLVSTAGPEAMVNSPGEYLLLVTNVANGCQDTSFVAVGQDTISPATTLPLPDTLSCTARSVALELQGGQPQYIYDWEGSGGSGTPGYEVEVPGMYSVLVTDTINGCAQELQAHVLQDTLAPIADAGPADTLTCNEPLLSLGGGASSMGDGFSFFWANSAGDTLAFGGQLNLEVGTAGQYILRVYNIANGCEAIDSVQIADRTAPPPVEAGPDQELTCSVSEVALGVPQEGYTFQWTGPCLSGVGAASQVIAGCEGVYILTVTDTLSGCQAIDSVQVTRDSLVPNAVLPDTVSLSCSTGLATLDGSTSAGEQFAWFFGGALQPGNELIREVSAPGPYMLIADDSNGACPDTAIAEVVIDCIPDVVIATADTITCEVLSVSLQATLLDSAPMYTFAWSGPNPEVCFLSGQGSANVEVRCPGEYQVIVENPLFGLSDTASVVVAVDSLAPLAEAGPGVLLTCDNPVAVLDASGSEQGAGIGYTWTKLDDESFVRDSFSILVNDAATYFLTVRDSANGCFAEDLVSVQRGDDLPDITFSSPIIPCLVDTFELTAFVLPQGQPYDFSWAGDEIIGSTDGASVLLDTAGMVRLTVTNTDTDCSSYRDLAVVQQECGPCIEVLGADNLTCIADSIVLRGQFCEPCEGCTLSWSTPDGVILSGEDELEAWIGAPGTYALTATDTLGFSATASLEVIADNNPPLANAGPDQVLTCETVEVTLSGQGQGSVNLVYQWERLSGAVQGGGVSPELAVSIADTFRLTVMDTLTGCASVDEVLVRADTLKPVASAGSMATITCAASTVALDGSGSAFGNNIQYEWAGPAGANVVGPTTFNPSVNTPGWYTIRVTDIDNGCFAIDSVQVEVSDDLPEAGFISDTVLTCANTVLLVEAPVELLPGQVSCWFRLNSSGQPTGPCVGTPFIDVGLPGVYRFEVTDTASDCTNGVNFTVGEDLLPPDVHLPDAALFPCSADSLLLEAGADVPASFVWASLEGGNIIPQGAAAVVFGPGGFQVSATALDNGCTSVDTINVAADDRVPVVDAGADTVSTCASPNVRLSGSWSVESGQGALSWEAMPGSILEGGNTATPLADGPGTYIFRVTDPLSGCVAEDTVAVADGRFFPQATISLPSLTLNCFADTLLADGQASTTEGPEGLLFEWRRGAFDVVGNNAAQLIAAPGGYRLLVTDVASGCRDTAQVAVGSDFAPPSVDLPGPLSINCQEDSVILQPLVGLPADSFTYRWTAPEGGVIAGAPLFLAAEQPGVYQLEVTSLQNGCDVQAEVLVIDNRELPAINLLPPDSLTCGRPTVLMDATGSAIGPGITYNWAAGEGGEVISGAASLQAEAGASAWYYLTVANTANGCINVDSVFVSASEVLLDSVAWSFSLPGCTEGGRIALDTVFGGTPPFLSALNGGAFRLATVYEGLSSGTFEVVLEDANGCRSEQTLVLPMPDVVQVDAGDDLTIEKGEEVTLEAAASSGLPIVAVAWWPEENGGSDSLSYLVAPALSTLYRVTVTDEGGCTAFDEVWVRIQEADGVYFPNVFSPNGDGQNDLFFPYGSLLVEEVLVFRVYDRWGNLLHEAAGGQANDPAMGWDGTFNGQEMDAAVYVWQAEIRLKSGEVLPYSGSITLLR